MIKETASLEEIVEALKKEWAHLEQPSQARHHCTEYLSQLRYILKEFDIPFSIHSAEIFDPENPTKFLGAHDFVQLKDGNLLDFTFSQFELGTPWPYRGPIDPKMFKHVHSLSLMSDSKDQEAANKVIADSTD